LNADVDDGFVTTWLPTMVPVSIFTSAAIDTADGLRPTRPEFTN